MSDVFGGKRLSFPGHQANRPRTDPARLFYARTDEAIPIARYLCFLQRVGRDRWARRKNIRGGPSGPALP